MFKTIGISSGAAVQAKVLYEIAVMTVILQLKRTPDGWVDRKRAYEVVVNGEMRAELRRGQKKTMEVDPGEVEVFLKVDWCRSRAIRLNLEPGSEVRLRCCPRSWMTVIYGITFGRNNYMQLKVE